MTTEIRAPQHAELNDELNAYLDGQLDSARAAQVAEHVAACAVCARELDTLRLTREAVRELPRLRAPRTFVLPAPEPVTPRWQQLLGWGWRLGTVASAACVLVAALTTGSGGSSPASTGTTMRSSAPEVKSEAPGQPPSAPQSAGAPRAAGEVTGVAAQDSAAGRAAAPAGSADLLGAQREARPEPSAAVPARPARATAWIIAALLLGLVSAYVYTLERRARTA